MITRAHNISPNLDINAIFSHFQRTRGEGMGLDPSQYPQLFAMFAESARSGGGSAARMGAGGGIYDFTHHFHEISKQLTTLQEKQAAGKKAEIPAGSPLQYILRDYGFSPQMLKELYTKPFHTIDKMIPSILRRAHVEARRPGEEYSREDIAKIEGELENRRRRQRCQSCPRGSPREVRGAFTKRSSSRRAKAPARWRVSTSLPKKKCASGLDKSGRN
jgi:hypothetical protein